MKSFMYLLPFSFLIQDNENPVISGCPKARSGNTDSGLATGNVTWTEPTATDNSGTQTLTSDYSPGQPFPIGTTTVTYNSTDAAGNIGNCTFDVVVTGASFYPLPLYYILCLGPEGVPESSWVVHLCVLTSALSCEHNN